MKESSNSIHDIKKTFTLAVPVVKAFNEFTDQLKSWWPKEYTWSGESLQTIEIEPKEGGRCFERGPHKFECDWGRVLVWNPPKQLAFTWQIGSDRVPVPDSNKSSDVEVTFEASGEDETEVTFIHRNFARHEFDAESYRDAMNSPQGWPYILNRYRDSV